MGRYARSGRYGDLRLGRRGGPYGRDPAYGGAAFRIPAPHRVAVSYTHLRHVFEPLHDRGVKNYVQAVVPGFQQSLDVAFPCAEHVARAVKQFAVQPDVGIAVHLYIQKINNRRCLP